MRLLCVACLALLGCRDYDALGLGPDDAGVAEDLAVVGDGPIPPDLPSVDMGPICVPPVVYDRDAGTPGAPAVMTTTETSLDLPLSSPQSTNRPPGRVTTGDVDGDGRSDVVTLAQTTSVGNGELALFRGSAGGLMSKWNTVLSDSRTNTTTQALLANLVPEEAGAQASAPRAELIVTGDRAFTGNVAAPYYSQLSVFRVNDATPLTPLFDTPYDLANIAPPSSVARAVALRAADLDVDGNIDLVVALDTNPVPKSAPFNQGGIAVIWGDAAMPSGGSSPYTWRVDRATFLAGTAAAPIAANPSRLVLADIDGDCRLEIAVSGLDVTGTGEQVSVIRVGGSGARSLAVTNAGVLSTFAPTTNGRLVAIDLERKGRRSLLVTEAAHWQLITVPSASGQALSAAQASAQPSNTIDCFAGDHTCVTGISGPVVADFDHDGAEDLFHWGFFLDAMPQPNYTGALFYRNNSMGALARTPAAGIAKRADPNEVTDSALIDVEADGFQEVVFVDNVGAKLYLMQVRP
jgi:hypothetical protein